MMDGIIWFLRMAGCCCILSCSIVLLQLKSLCRVRVFLMASLFFSSTCSGKGGGGGVILLCSCAMGKNAVYNHFC